MLDSTTGTIQEQTGNETNQGGTGTPAVNQGGEKYFSQADVDNIIKNRLSKYQDYDALRKYKEDAEQANLSQMEKLNKKLDELKPYKDMATKQQTVLDGLLEQELEAIPEEMRGLVPDTFDTLQKIEYIRKNSAIFKSSPKPNLRTEADPAQPSTPGLYNGKYSTLEEFAIKDPKAYHAWRKAGGGNELLKY